MRIWYIMISNSFEGRTIMQKSITIIFLSLFCMSSYAAQKAITDNGSEVILYENGTWKYANKQDDQLPTISSSSKKYYKNKSATFQLKSKKNNVAIWLNPKQWSFQKSKANSEAEYQFMLKGQDLHGLLITEAIQIPMETLTQIALDNARKAAADAKVVSRQYRVVNGQKMIAMEIIGTIQGIKFHYYGYYYSNSKGTTQLLTYTSDNLFGKYKGEAEQFLNGLALQ